MFMVNVTQAQINMECQERTDKLPETSSIGNFKWCKAFMKLECLHMFCVGYQYDAIRCKETMDAAKDALQKKSNNAVNDNMFYDACYPYDGEIRKNYLDFEPIGGIKMTIIVGAIVGGLVLITLILIVVYFGFVRKKPDSTTRSAVRSKSSVAKVDANYLKTVVENDDEDGVMNSPSRSISKVKQDAGGSFSRKAKNVSMSKRKLSKRKFVNTSNSQSTMKTKATKGRGKSVNKIRRMSRQKNTKSMQKKMSMDALQNVVDLSYKEAALKSVDSFNSRAEVTAAPMETEGYGIARGTNINPELLRKWVT